VFEDMRHNKNLKTHLRMFFMALLMIYLTLPSSFHSSLGSPDYTYYGVVPSKIFLYLLNDANNFTSGWVLGSNSSRTGSPGLNGKTVATKALLAIVAAENDTNVQVYDLTLNSLISQDHIDSMEKHLVLLNNGTVFKVVSDKQVSVLLLNYQNMPVGAVTEGPLPYTFYTDVNGMYVGKKFFLMASEQIFYSENKFYTLLALEKSKVTVTRDDGQQNEYSLDANSYTTMLLDVFKVYKIESTGNIMVQSSTTWADIGSSVHRYKASYPVPCATGGFVGQFFVAKARKGWDPDTDYGFRISASEDTKVKLYDLDTKQVINDLSVKGGTGIGFQPSANAIGVQSDKPITLFYFNNGTLGTSRTAQIGVGVMFIGIQPNQNTPIYLPTDANVEAYFFANEETELTVDGSSQTIQPDQPKLYILLGSHTIQADHNVILQVNFWPNEPEYQGLWFPGAAIPSIETVANNPTITLTPLGEGFPMMYVIAGAGAAVAVIVVFLVIRRRGGKPS
jgi:WD40 repeat protein